jgi:hypothetical protein
VVGLAEVLDSTIARTIKLQFLRALQSLVAEREKGYATALEQKSDAAG